MLEVAPSSFHLVSLVLRTRFAVGDHSAGKATFLAKTGKAEVEVWSVGLAADILQSSLGRSARIPQRPEVMCRRRAD